ncbi:MAG TPA: carbohydrate porin [Cellvibrio sp.]|nr:carbohydrate porin [Cellvibrio sp.]
MLKRILVASLLLPFLPSNALAEPPPAYDWANALTLESVTNLDGGVAEGTRTLANLDLSLAIDTQAAGWWNNGNVFIYVLGNYGKAPSDLTGDLQTISNIQTDNNLKLYEFWYEHSFAGGSVKLLAGLHDYNSTFYSLESAGLFTTSSFGIGAEVAQVGPSIFSTTSAAVQLTLAGEHQYLLLATYDGIAGDPDHRRGTHIKFKKSDGLFNAIEWGVQYERSYKLAVGAWQHTAEVENPIDGTISDSNSGFYLIGEKYFTENLVAFFQYGQADADKNQLDSYLGAGVTLSNAWVEDDAIGLAYASVENGSPFLRMNVDVLSKENIVELSYLCPVTSAVSVQTSLYAIDNPSMSPELDNALAFGLRAYIEF